MDPRCQEQGKVMGNTLHVAGCNCKGDGGDPKVYEAAEECAAALLALTGIQRNCVLNILKIRGVLP